MAAAVEQLGGLALAELGDVADGGDGVKPERGKRVVTPTCALSGHGELERREHGQGAMLGREPRVAHKDGRRQADRRFVRDEDTLAVCSGREDKMVQVSETPVDPLLPPDLLD